MSHTTNLRQNAEGSWRPTTYLNKKAKDGDFELRKIVSNVATRTSYISIPVQFIRKMRLSQGQVCSIQLLEDEDQSRLVIQPLHIPGVDK